MNSPWERLKEERLRLGFSQEAFGALGGVKKLAQIKYEKGERQPDSKYFTGIAAAGANVDYILTGVPPALRAKLTVMADTTKAATGLELPAREGELVRDVLYGVAMKDTAMVRDTIENYYVERQTKAAKKTAKKGAR